MPIPDYQTIMLPLLQLAADGKEHSLREAYERLASEFSLTAEERRELLPSGTQSRFNNRVGWARTYLKQAGLLTDTRRGHFKITNRGREALSSGVARIDKNYLEQFEEFQEFQQRKGVANGTQSLTPSKPVPVTSDQTPEEQLESAHQTLQADLVQEVLESIKACTPEFFERLVVDVLVTMGYGGSRKEAGQAVGGSGDGGIDGIIKEDRLGLDVIYVQAKRWEGPVSRPDVQKFAGALQGVRARKGIMITTSSFTKGAEEYAGGIASKIILVDGARLADLMIEHDVGVTPVSKFEVKRLDQDYFTEG